MMSMISTTTGAKLLVSIAFKHNPAASNFDSMLTKASGRLVKVSSRNDNEWGFSNRMLDTTVALMNAQSSRCRSPPRVPPPEPCCSGFFDAPAGGDWLFSNDNARQASLAGIGQSAETTRPARVNNQNFWL